MNMEVVEWIDRYIETPLTLTEKLYLAQTPNNIDSLEYKIFVSYCLICRLCFDKTYTYVYTVLQTAPSSGKPDSQIIHIPTYILDNNIENKSFYEKQLIFGLDEFISNKFSKLFDTEILSASLNPTLLVTNKFKVLLDQDKKEE